METSKIVNALRRLWLFSPERREAIKSSKVHGGYKCSVCGGIIPNQKLVKADHIEQVRADGWDWNKFMERLFCPPVGLQIMCKACHDKKSKEERERNAMLKYGRGIEQLMFFFKCLYYKETPVHKEWECFKVSDAQYDSLENCLRRISNNTNTKFSVIDYVGFQRGTSITDLTADMCSISIGSTIYYDDVIEALFNKHFRRLKDGTVKLNKLKY